MILHCTNKNCKNNRTGWDYKGKNKSKATCPDCHRLVEIKRE